MLRALSIICLLIFFPVALTAQIGSFEIQLVNDSSIRFNPGASANIAFKLINNTTEDQKVSLKIDQPIGWRCFSDLNSIPTRKSQSTIKILSFSIPINCMAGDYLINIEAFDSLEHKVAKISLPVTIKSKFKLNIEKIIAPEYVFAGDTFTVQFMVQNLSNSIAEIDALLKGTGNDEKLRFLLNPDSSVFISRSIIAEKGFLNYVQKSVSLTASLVDMPEIRVSNNHFYKLIPSKGIKYDPYERFPVAFSTLFFTDKLGGERLYALMVNISGQGFLDENKTKAFNFNFQGPNRRGKPLYGVYDEYWIEYLAPKSKLLLGDNTYSLSYLTEFSRYGRGARAEHSFNNFTVGSFIVIPRFYPTIKREIAAYATYSESKKLILQVGYLSKQLINDELAHLITLNGSGAPFKWGKIDWEYALGSFGSEYKQAIKTELSLHFRSVRLFYNYTMAEKYFPGYFSDTRYMLANANVSISKKISAGVNYSYNHQNAALDTLYGSAPFSENIYFSINYQFMKDAGLSTSYNYRYRLDRMEPMKFHYSENSMRISLYKHFRKFRWNLMGEYGNTDNLLMIEDKRFNVMYQGRLTMNYQISAKFNINAYVNYRESKRYLVDDDKNWIYGTSMNTVFNKKMSASVNYQSSYSVEEYYRDRSILDGRMRYSPNQNNNIEISMRYHLERNSLDQKEISIMAKYIRTINIPAGKKKNIGKLSGKIINNGVNNVAGLVISIGADKAVTDKNGYFNFPMLPAGNYYLMIDYSNAGVNAITVMPPPFQVEVFPGIETKFDIGITLASNITGEILIVRDESADNKSYAEIKEKMGKILIEVKNENEVFRIFTKEDGKFSFEGLRPGPWTVKVYERDIPGEFELVTDLFHLSLVPGQTEHIEIKVKEKRRRIRFQKTFDNNDLKPE
jgi:hypothetical protein